MRADTHRYLVAYDIPDDRRRTRISDCLSGFGDRLQYSVFIVDASPAKFIRLRDAIQRLLVLAEDSVVLCDLGLLSKQSDATFIKLGCVRTLTSDSSFIV